jgi:iron(III) transport system permease protein
MAALVIYPALRLYGDAHFTSATLAFLTRNDTITALRLTVVLSLAVSGIATALGSSLAYLCTRTNMIGKDLFRQAVLLSYFTPSVFLAFAYVVLMGSNEGPLNRLLRALTGGRLTFDVMSPGGFVLLGTFEIVPVVFLIVSTSMASLHGELEDVARITGASRWGTNLRVTLPLALPGIASAALLSFVNATALFGVPAVLGVRVASVAIQGAFSYPFRYDRAAALTLALRLIAACAVVAQAIVLRKQRRFAVISGRWRPPPVVSLGRPTRFVSSLFAWVYIVAALAAPYIVLLATASSRRWTAGPLPGNLTLSNFAAVITDDTNRHAVLNSPIYAVFAASLGVVLGASIGAVVVLSTVRWLRLTLDQLVSAAWAFPSIGLGAAYLVAFLHPPVLYGTPYILILAYLTKFSPLAVRSVAAALQQHAPELREAARITGATAFGSARRITLPLLAPSLIASWILIFVPSIHEVSSSILLVSPGHETLAVAAMFSFESSAFEVAAALGVVALVETILMWALIQRFRGAALLRPIG